MKNENFSTLSLDQQLLMLDDILAALLSRCCPACDVQLPPASAPRSLCRECAAQIESDYAEWQAEQAFNAQAPW